MEISDTGTAKMFRRRVRANMGTDIAGFTRATRVPVSRPGFWKVLAATTFAVWGIAATAEATPVTYEFAGLLNAAINGSTVVFGHFTLDAAAASITTFSFTTPTGLPTDPE